MKDKIYAAILAIVLVSGIGLAVEPIATGGSGGGVGEIMPYYYDYDYPRLVVLKGVAVDGDVEPAVFIGIGYEDSSFKESYLIVDGNIYELDLEGRTYDSETRTTILQYDAGNEKLTLVLKSYSINYREIVVASGQFGDYILNMRMVGYEQPVYRALAEETEMTSVEEAVVSEVVKKIKE